MTDQKRQMTVGDLPGSYAIDVLLTAEGRNGLWYLIRARNSKPPRHVQLFAAYGSRNQTGIEHAQIECSYPGDSSGYDAAVAAIARAIARGQ